MSNREDHRTGDTTWNNPRTREKQRRNEGRLKQGAVSGHHSADDEPWPTEPSKPRGINPINPLGR
jgi:hypothetical protein